jgi:flavin-dependent dehydrogenase
MMGARGLLAEYYDVIVVGAGPGGCAAALHLVRGDDALRVDLVEGRLDSEFQTYHRMCGEGLSARGFQEVPAGGEQLILHRITSVLEHWPGGVDIEAPVNGFIVDRIRMLVQMRSAYLEAGGRMSLEKVTGVTHGPDGFSVHCSSGASLDCRYLIGADGAHSVVRRDLFQERPEVMMPVEQYLVDAVGPTDRLEFFFDQRYVGKYRWTFPAGGGAKIGFPAGSDPPPPNPLVRQARPIPIGRFGRFSEGNACLVGDAAAQANPITFGGIRNALTAGRMAASAILKDDVPLYDRLWKESELADPVFIEAFRLLRSMDNQRMAQIMEPLRHANPFTLMRALMNDRDFQVLYRAHVLKLGAGW